MSYKSMEILLYWTPAAYDINLNITLEYTIAVTIKQGPDQFNNVHNQANFITHNIITNYDTVTIIYPNVLNFQ